MRKVHGEDELGIRVTRSLTIPVRRPHLASPYRTATVNQRFTYLAAPKLTLLGALPL